MVALASLTFIQVATRVVVREDLPNPLRGELEALAVLLGDYFIIGMIQQ